jgi:hypothetical protein
MEFLYEKLLKMCVDDTRVCGFNIISYSTTLDYEYYTFNICDRYA